MGFLRKLNMAALPDKKKENLITALYFGFILILLAVVYFVNAHIDLWGSFVNFFSKFILATVPGTNIALPAPSNPASYTLLYKVVYQFCIGLGILEIAVLTLRIWLNSPVTRKAETIENIVFWLGTSYLVVTYLVNISIISEWFVFWAGIILIGGLSLLARSFVLIAKR